MDTQQTPAIAVDHLVKRRRGAAHFEADIEALLHAQSLLDPGQRLAARVNRERRTKPPRERQAPGIDIGHDHMARSRVADHGGGHDPDGPGAGDQHVLAQNWK